MLEYLVIKFLLVCAGVSLVGGVYNAVIFMHKSRRIHADRTPQEKQKTRTAAIIFGVQSVILIWLLILLCALISYPLFHSQLK
jgi:uncharacterized membrane protein